MVRVVVSDPEQGKSYQLEPEESRADDILGLRIGEEFDGEVLGLNGYKLRITGGSDAEGFAMRKDVRGSGRVKALLKKGPGYKPTKDGERRRKTVRGNQVSDDTVQLNTKITEKGEKSIEEALGLESVEETEEDTTSEEE